MSIWIFFKLIGSLALLMYGMKSMSDSLQKMAGPQLRHVLGAMTTNRFTGMLTGMFVTAAVQSSTATTLMTVSFVNAGLLTLVQAISVIMGAHIGTTVTAWIMSLGFSFNITDFVYPAFFVGIILIYMKKRKMLGDFLFGVAFLFLGLGTLRQTGIDMDLAHNEAVVNFFAMFDSNSFWSALFFLFMGTVLTLCVQSSAAIMAITMILCSTGVLPLEQGIHLVLGENIGTTITSNIVALGANVSARRAAFSHMSINVLGVLWVSLLFTPFVNMVCSIVGYDLHAPVSLESSAKISMVLAAFHSAFNISNTFLLIWFVPQIEKFVCKVIKPKTTEAEDFRLHFITAGIMETPELSLLEAQKEIVNFVKRIHRMFGLVLELYDINEDDAFNKLFSRIEKYENISDSMEIEIAKYLDSVSDAHLSSDSKAKIRAMLREISEIESIGDSCYNLARSISHKHSSKDGFTDKQNDHVRYMFDLVNSALLQMDAIMEGSSVDANKSFNIERSINNYRTLLKNQNVNDVNDKAYDYQMGVFYMDIINECEKLGDYVVNVVEARTNTKEKKD